MMALPAGHTERESQALPRLCIMVARDGVVLERQTQRPTGQGPCPICGRLFRLDMLGEHAASAWRLEEKQRPAEEQQRPPASAKIKASASC